MAMTTKTVTTTAYNSIGAKDCRPLERAFALIRVNLLTSVLGRTSIRTRLGCGAHAWLHEYDARFITAVFHARIDLFRRVGRRHLRVGQDGFEPEAGHHEVAGGGRMDTVGRPIGGCGGV